MKIKILFVVTLFVIITTSINCTHKWCINRDACNYDERADKSDGSCLFADTITFWQKTGSGYGVTKVTIGTGTLSLSITSQVPSTPMCNASGCATFALCPQGAQGGTYTYTASEASPGTMTWSGTFKVTGNGCLTIQLQ